MEKAELQAGLRRLNDEEGLKILIRELCASPDQYLPIFREMLQEDRDLSSAESRQELRLVVLYLALQSDHASVIALLDQLKNTEVHQHFSAEDWLFNDLPRLLGRMMQSGDLSVLGDLVLDAHLPEFLREQFLLTIMYRWMQKADRNSDVAAVLKKLLVNKLGGLHNDQLSMALIINAIAVDGVVLKPQILSFYHACGKSLATMFPDKALQTFYGLGPEKIRALLKQNYDAAFGEPEKEVDRLFHPPEESGTPQELTSAAKPIVREGPKISRNDPCPCGSGKKYKKCCGA